MKSIGNYRFRTILLLLGIFYKPVSAQTDAVTEDRLIKTSYERTSLKGYGNIFFQQNANLKKTDIHFERFVFIIQHPFNSKFSLFTESGLDNSLRNLQSNTPVLSVEQAYLKYQPNSSLYFIGGIFLPRIGLLNETHLPTTFWGNERNQIETYIIPSNWRMLGLGCYGTFKNIPLRYSLTITNGLSSERFTHGSVIRNGRLNGLSAGMNSLAASGSLQYHKPKLQLQVSSYIGGSVDLNMQQADSLELTSGPFGTPVFSLDASCKYQWKNVSISALAASVSIPQANDINRAYANNTPQQAWGAYLEIGYNAGKLRSGSKTRDLFLFTRFETLDMNSTIPENGIKDKTLNQQHWLFGLNFHPLQQIVFKADIRLIKTGNQNPALSIHPIIDNYKKNNSLVSIGTAYSF